MLRFYAIAALIVVLIGSALVAHRLATSRPHVVAAKGPPPAAHPGPNNGFVTTPEPFFRGQGGWVLSALPSCFEQVSSIEGPTQALTFHVPPISACMSRPKRGCTTRRTV
jgi:DNA-binding transcriptional LysR family regulator